MATAQEKEDLVEVLKGGINTYTIHLTGYGGEIVLGTITPEQYAYWQENDLDEHISDWDNEMAVPDSMKICEDGSWHDCDDIAHESGVEFSDLCYATVYDSEDNEVWQCRLGSDALEAEGVDPEGFNHDEFYVRYDSSASHAFMAQSIEKGRFFSGSFETYGRFDPNKLSFSTIDIEGWQLVNGVSYASVEIDEDGGYDTTGKGLECRVFAVNAEEQV
jgi:hypothetical protein